MSSLEKNVFYNSLISSHSKRYKEAADNGWLVCVPINDSVDARLINDKFISAHILKPSPLLKNHFVPANSKHKHDVEIDGGLLRVTRGFNDNNQDIVNIISEESAFNTNNDIYRILICDNPLINVNNKKVNCSQSHKAITYDMLITLEECQNFLNVLSSHHREILESKVNILMESYLVLPNNIEDAANRLKVVIDWGIQCFSSYFTPSEFTPDFYLESAVESYVIGLAYPKVFPIIKECFAADNKLLYEKYVSLSKHKINPFEFGAQKIFENFDISNNIIDQIVKIETLITPLEKLNCLRRNLDLINEQLVKTAEINRSFREKAETIYVMSDDLIATVICVLVEAKLTQFSTHINFIQTFSWYLPRNNEFAYSLVTFEAAKEFIKNYTFENESKSSSTSLANKVPTVKNSTKKSENSLENRKKESLDNTLTVKHSLEKSFNDSQTISHIDRELEKIDKLLDTSSNKTKYETTVSEDVSDLGEFLASLSENSFSVGSGKQFD